MNFDVFLHSKKKNARGGKMDVRSIQNNGREITWLHCSETRSKFMKETELGQVVTIDQFFR
jgi:hypothetical protein